MGETQTRPIALSVISWLLLINTLGLMLFGAVLLFGSKGSTQMIMEGLVLLVGGLAMGRAVGDFLRFRINGLFPYRLGAVLLSVSFGIHFADVFPSATLKSWTLSVLLSVFALAFFFLLEAIIREQLHDA